MNSDKKDRKIEHTEEEYGFKKEAREFPVMCVIGLSYVCNSRCPHCPYTTSDIRSGYKNKLFMKEKTFKIIADQCGKYGAWTRITGAGEPMLHKQAVDLMEYAKKVGAKVGLITNGSLFTEENTRRILAAGVDMVEFSVDAADPETYDILRTGLSWETLLENIRRMVKMRNEMQSTTKIIASGVNQKEVNIEKVAAFWEPIIDNFQKRKFLTWGGVAKGTSADSTPYLDPSERIPCPFLFERLNIDSDGRVILCGFDIEARTNLGNIHEKTIKEIWHGEEFTYFRDMHLKRQGDKIPMCATCTDWKYRSWKHNYWKIVQNAEEKRKNRVDD